jgi:hypothetical protein
MAAVSFAWARLLVPYLFRRRVGRAFLRVVQIGVDAAAV